MDQDTYRKMYAVLCGAVFDAIDALQDPLNGLYARGILETAIRKAEDLYLAAEEES